MNEMCIISRQPIEWVFYNDDVHDYEYEAIDIQHAAIPMITIDNLGDIPLSVAIDNNGYIKNITEIKNSLSNKTQPLEMCLLVFKAQNDQYTISFTPNHVLYSLPEYKNQYPQNTHENQITFFNQIAKTNFLINNKYPIKIGFVSTYFIEGIKRFWEKYTPYKEQYDQEYASYLENMKQYDETIEQEFDRKHDSILLNVINEILIDFIPIFTLQNNIYYRYYSNLTFPRNYPLGLMLKTISENLNEYSILNQNINAMIVGYCHITKLPIYSNEIVLWVKSNNIIMVGPFTVKSDEIKILIKLSAIEKYIQENFSQILKNLTWYLSINHSDLNWFAEFPIDICIKKKEYTSLLQIINKSFVINNQQNLSIFDLEKRIKQNILNFNQLNQKGIDESANLPIIILFNSLFLIPFEVTCLNISGITWENIQLQNILFQSMSLKTLQDYYDGTYNLLISGTKYLRLKS